MSIKKWILTNAQKREKKITTRTFKEAEEYKKNLLTQSISSIELELLLAIHQELEAQGISLGEALVNLKANSEINKYIPKSEQVH